jgi:hypothetical protein
VHYALLKHVDDGKMGAGFREEDAEMVNDKANHSSSVMGFIRGNLGNLEVFTHFYVLLNCFAAFIDHL